MQHTKTVTYLVCKILMVEDASATRRRENGSRGRRRRLQYVRIVKPNKSHGEFCCRS
jgi:hypothetical protein